MGRLRLVLTLLVLVWFGASAAASDSVLVGAAKVDITPSYPIRLSGYGNRRDEATEAAQRLWAKALAIGGDDGVGPALLITFENCGVTPEIRADVSRRLAQQASIRDERLVISVSHSHTAPCLKDWGPFLFGADIPAEHQQHIDRYTRELTDKLVEVTLAALKNRRPARLSWGEGKVEFAVNRRVLVDGSWTGFGEQADGPVDHSLPVLAAHGADGKLVAVVANYACHCTTLGGGFNKIAGDWLGYAQGYIEQDHPGAIALITIGTGADANPSPRGELEVCQQHGRALANEVSRLLKSDLKLLPNSLACQLLHVDLPFDKLPTRDEWVAKSEQNGAPGYHAKKFLDRLDAGETIPTTLRYPIGVWTFGTDLAMVFLGGEVVVDYGIRLKEENDAARIWITAYANDVPCYIPSKRILREGGYEADYSMLYYARPTRLAPETEGIIADGVQKLLPPQFYSAAKQQDFPPPLSPDDSLEAIRVADGMKVELVAAEPLITDPVAFDWGPDGRLWVVEMHDYPNGIGWREGTEELGEPGGRVRVLEDTDGDGRYDKSTLFLDKLPFPTGIKVWRDGVLITAAPEVIFAKDTNGDDRADHRETLYVGFGEGNQQHRVNGLRWGLDNWLYLGNGDSGGKIRALKTGEEVEIRGRDLRIRPDDGSLDPQSGQTQYGRCRDDWGNWFGGNNSAPTWHYVLADEYLRRNPYALPPDVRKHVSVTPGAAPVYPASRTLARFNDFDRANRFTSACSPIIYRDELLGVSFVGNSFVCEPVHNLVQREIVEPNGVTFTSHRAESEQQSEFFASTDNWCRPSMVRTGPDGALWISDMYRFVIEHPKWIPAEWQRKLDLRAGDTMGRIYRVVPIDKPARPMPRLDKLDTGGLVASLESPNGWVRDMAQQMLLWQADKPAAIPALRRLSFQGTTPQSRIHALRTLQGLDAIDEGLLAVVLNDSHPAVLRHAIQVAEPHIGRWESVANSIRALVYHDDPHVRLQLAYSLGEWDDPAAARALALSLIRNEDDVYITAAAMSSLNKDNIGLVFSHVLAGTTSQQASKKLVERLLGQAAAFGDRDAVRTALDTILKPQQVGAAEHSGWQFSAVAGVLETLRRQNTKLDALLTDATRQQVSGLQEAARRVAADSRESSESRMGAIRLIGCASIATDRDAELLAELLVPQNSPALQSAAVAALGSLGRSDAPRQLLANWQAHSPALRGEILDAILSRPSWTAALLDVVESGAVLTAHLDARRRQQLLQHEDQAVRDRAAGLLARASGGDRQQVLERLQHVATLTGDPLAGKAVFAKRCAACHQLEGVGHATGPDLVGLTDKSPQSMLIAMLDPNRAVEDKYLDYTVATVDGRVLSGMLAAETGASITLVAADGIRFEIPRSDLEQLRSTGKSMMPEGLERDVAPQEMADVIAYVRSVSQPPKQFEGNEPKLADVRDDGSIRLLATDCRIYGPTLVFEPKYRNLGWWQSEQDRAEWDLEVRKAGRYRVSIEFACDNSSAGNRFLFTVAGQTLGGRIEGTGTWDNYQTATIGDVELPAGPTESAFRSDGPIRGALLDLRTVRLVPMEP